MTQFFDMRVTELDQPHRMAGVATGELEGTGIWTLNQEGPLARAHYEWRVRVTKPWMQLAAPLARPIFAWNHGQVMQAGGAGLARRLGVRRVGRCQGLGRRYGGQATPGATQGMVSTGAKPPPGVRKLVVWPRYRRAASNCTRPA